MIKKEIQNQQSGDSSTNIQARNVKIGVSASEARNIALDIYKANFIELSNVAAKVALERIESFNDKFLAKLIESNQDMLGRLHSPSLQISLLNAQKECVRSNDDNIEDLLIEVLVERSKEESRGIMQIAYEESIKALPKLTNKQINILTLNFLLNDAYYYAGTLEGLKNYLSKWLIRFKTKINLNSPSIRHIEYCGCGKLTGKSSRGFPHKYSQSYPGILTKGFTLDDFKKDLGDDKTLIGLLKECDNNPELFQLNANSSPELNRLIDKIGYKCDKEERVKIHSYLRRNIMNHQEQKEFFINIEPEAAFIFEINNIDISALELSPVGLAIAMANFKKTTGAQLGLPYWLRDA